MLIFGASKTYNMFHNSFMDLFPLFTILIINSQLIVDLQELKQSEIVVGALNGNINWSKF